MNKRFISMVGKGSVLCALFLSAIACSPKAPDTPDRLYWAEVEVPPSPEVNDSLLQTGATVFASSCASCHGEEGRGDGVQVSTLTTHPRDFSLALFKLRSTDGFPSDADLYRTITVGFPAYGMPSTEVLSPEDRWALVYHVKSLVHAASPSTSLQPGTPITIPEARKYNQRSIDLGKVLFDRMGCALCHGSKGSGGVSIPLVDAQGNPITPRKFSDGLETFKAGGRPEDIVRILMTGMAGTPMPSYAKTGADNEQLWDLAHYIHDLATSPDMDSP